MTRVLTAILAFTATLFFIGIVQRPLFMLYNKRSSSRPIRPIDVMAIYRHGLRGDTTVACYLTSLPLLILWGSALIPSFSPMPLLVVYSCVTAVAYAAIIVGDTALYDFWHFKIDASVLSYLKSPRAAAASVSAVYLMAAIAAIIAVAAAYGITMITTYHAGLAITLPPLSPSWLNTVAANLAFAALTALFVIGIRGLGIRPCNPAQACFSPEPFFNHSAVNAVQNFTYSLSDKDDGYATRFQFMDTDECRDIVGKLYPRTGEPTVGFLNTPRPNVLLIVWESLSARFVEVTGGDPEITPALNRLAREGVAFTRMDCGSFLTDRGLACIISGIPGQPTTYIGKYTRKLPALPALPRQLRGLGYKTAVVHGGDLSVRRKADFYLASGHDRLITINDFPSSAPRCKWGIHDEETFTRVYDEIMSFTARDEKWMMTLQTLSSHEPFDVPYHRLVNKMDNAFAYTDEQLGRFIGRMRETAAWDDTLIVIVGDHGVHHGSEYGPQLPRDQYVHIPAVFTGGAISRHMTIDTITAQTDIAATILGQMGLPHDEFPFSRDVLAQNYTEPTSFHSYKNGIFMRDNDGFIEVDTETGTVKSGDGSDNRLKKAQAVLQHLYRYLDSL